MKNSVEFLLEALPGNTSLGTAAVMCGSARTATASGDVAQAFGARRALAAPFSQQDVLEAVSELLQE